MTITVSQGRETAQPLSSPKTENLTNSESDSVFPVNINTAEKEELMNLPGVGDMLAQRILDYRGEAGSFSKVTDLMLVEGIGEKRMEELLEYITTGG